MDVRTDREREWHKKIVDQCDSIENGWIEFDIPGEKEGDPTTKLKVPRIPLNYWTAGSVAGHVHGWKNVVPSGMKMQMDNRNHSDCWVGAGLPLKYAYRENAHTWQFDDNGDEILPPADPMREFCARVREVFSDYHSVRNDARTKNSSYLVRPKEVVRGRIQHVFADSDLLSLAEDARHWASRDVPIIFVVPDCSPKYDVCIRTGAAIITLVGSQAAHLVKVAREDDIPVILCKDAYNEYAYWEQIYIYPEHIYSSGF